MFVVSRKADDGSIVQEHHNSKTSFDLFMAGIQLALLQDPAEPITLTFAGSMDWLDTTPVVIPDDGAEHACVCGSSGYRAWDGDGFLRGKAMVVTDDEGRTVEECRRCDRQLEARPAQEKQAPHA